MNFQGVQAERPCGDDSRPEGLFFTFGLGSMSRNLPLHHLLTDREPRLARLPFLWAVGEPFRVPAHQPTPTQGQKCDLGETFRRDADSNRSEYLRSSPQARRPARAGVVRHDPRRSEGYKPRSSADHSGCATKTHDNFTVFPVCARANTQSRAEVTETKASSFGPRRTQRSSFAPRLIVLMSYVGSSSIRCLSVFLIEKASR